MYLPLIYFPFPIADTDIVVPEKSPAGDTVTAIGNGKYISGKYTGFYNCEDITSVAIPEGVTSIGNYAFEYCYSLTSITFAENSQLTSIGERAFEDCRALTSIEIPASVTSIGYEAFSGCGLTSIEIPASVTSIREYAFNGCDSLESITVVEGNTVYHSAGNCLIETESKTLIAVCKNSIIPTDGSVTIIGFGVFADCDTLTSIDIPASITYIEDEAFYGCSSLTSIEIPASVTDIGVWAFYQCTSLTSVTFAENSQLTSISDHAFYGCSGLKNIEIPASVTSIGDYVFGNCPIETATIPTNAIKHIKKSLASVKTVVITSGTSIGNYAFSNCSYLTSVEIPASVTSIGNCAFARCESLEKIIFLGTEEEWNAIEKGENWDESTGDYVIIFRPNNEPECSKGLEFTSNGDGTCYVSGIGTCTDLDIVIPETSPDGDTVTSIGYAAFSDCGLTSIEIPASVTSIGYCAFEGCRSLTSIEIPASVTSIGDSAFSGCSSLASIEIPNGVTFIDCYAFMECNALTSIDVPASVTYIEMGAFMDCTSLTSINYNGTKPQWNAISKGRDWNSSTGYYTVYCTDGNIAKANS